MEEKEVEKPGPAPSFPPARETTGEETDDVTRQSGSASSRDAEDERDEARRNNPNGLTKAESGVSVERAEAEFAGLQRELSGLSRLSRRISKAASRRRNSVFGKDTEAIPDSPDSETEQFDLEAYLRGGLAAEQAAGIRPKHIGVSWDGLTVKGMGGSTNYVTTFPDSIVGFFDIVTPVIRMLGLGPKGTEATLLDGFRGVCKPGELVLVLGKPGSGCTTFLRSIANQRYGYTDVSGDVSYGPFTAKEFKAYRGEAVYNEEDDVHHATLTVEQTLAFALDTKIAGKLPEGMSKAQLKEDIVTMLLKMFNIEHTRKTVVGGHFVRGISGGEKKRVSVAEMMCTNACVLSWDNSTRGLDASTALDFVKSLRIQADLYKTSTFVSLYQASENIYNLFDRVLVIDSGRQVYFGPATEARRYFEGLGFLPRPRQTTPDYVTGCTDEFERDYADGYSAENAPHSPDTLREAFSQSKYATMLDEEMAQYKKHMTEEAQKYEDFRVAVKESKQRGAGRYD